MLLQEAPTVPCILLLPFNVVAFKISSHESKDEALFQFLCYFRVGTRDKMNGPSATAHGGEPQSNLLACSALFS